MSAQQKTIGHDWWFSGALIFVAFLPRLFVALNWAHEPVWDGHYYHYGATRLAEGLGYSEDVVLNGIKVWRPWAHYPVGYSLFLSLFYRIFGDSILVAPLVGTFVGSFTTLIVHRISRYGLSSGRARIAGTLCALHPGLIAYSALVMTETTAALFVLSALWAALALKTKPFNLILAGLLIGCASLIRPVCLAALPALLLLSPWREWKESWRIPLGRVLVRVHQWRLEPCYRRTH